MPAPKARAAKQGAVKQRDVKQRVVKQPAVKPPTVKPLIAARTPASARRVLLTILGEFVYPNQHSVWNSALVECMVAAGQSEKSARQAILRAAASGWLAKNRYGRQVCWTLTRDVLALMAEGAQRVFPAHRAVSSWDGRWLILSISLPHSHRKIREKLYRALQWAGFGSPSSALWVSPHTDRLEEIGRVIRRLGLAETTFSFVGHATAIGLTDQRVVQLAWDLDGLARRYQELLRLFKRTLSLDDRLLHHYLHLVIEWEKLPLIDPRLPSALLPSAWVGQHFAAELGNLLEQWRHPARLKWHEITARLPPIAQRVIADST
jgi:phenylacetic acid degradation operon negative regulatory protein